MSNQKSSPKLAVFDLDDTLVHEGFADEHPILCDDTLGILTMLRDMGVKIALASHNHKSEVILQNSDIRHYFDSVQAYHDYTDKQSHLKNIMKELSIEPKQTVFFDDLIENLNGVARLGVKVVPVSNIRGVTMSDIRTVFNV